MIWPGAKVWITMASTAEPRKALAPKTSRWGAKQRKGQWRNGESRPAMRPTCDYQVARQSHTLNPNRVSITGPCDLPPLKWSSLKYVLTLEDEINGEEAAYG